MKKDDFPIFKNLSNLVYLDNAATTQKPDFVLDAIKQYYSTSNANVHRGLYELSELATEQYEESRKVIAKFLGVDTEEIIFTGGTTDGMNGISYMLEDLINENDVIITTKIEHHSSLLPFQKLANEKKAHLKFIDLNEDLTLDMEHYKNLLKEGNTKIVVVTGMSNVTGYMAPIEEITKLAHEKGALVVVDGAQLIPHKKVNLLELDVDFLTFSGHKIYGPTGIGVLYGKKEHLERFEPFRVGGGMITRVDYENAEWKISPEKFEAGTPNIEGAIGLAAAIKYVESIGFEIIEEHEKSIFQYAFTKLKENPDLDVYSTDSEDFTGVISFNVKGIHAHDTSDILGQQNIAVRAGHHCCQILMKQVLGVDSTARISFSVYNTLEDIDRLIDALKKVKETLG